MSMLLDTYSWLSTAVLLAIAVLACRNAVRRHERRALAVALGLLALVTVAGRIQALTDYRLRPLAVLSTVAFAACGYALIEYRASIIPLSRRWRLIAIGASAGAAIFTLAVRIPPGEHPKLSPIQTAAVNVLILVWVACVIEPAARLWLESRHRSAVEAAHLRLVSAGYVGVAGILLLAIAAASVFKRHPALGLPLLPPLIAIHGLLYAAVAPPRWLLRRWLRNAGQRAAAFLVPVGAWYWDVGSDLIVWSDELYRQFDIDPGSFGGTYDDYLDFLLPEERDEVNDRIQRHFATRQPFEFDHRVRTKTGEIRWFHSRGEVLADPTTGQTVAMMGTAQNISERKTAELALVRSLERERQATDQLRAVDAMKDAFLEAVSHELRTPLAAVIGMSETLANDNLVLEPGMAKTLAKRVAANGRRLERLLGDLLDLDRITRGVLEPNRRPTHLGHLARAVMEHVDLGSRSVDVRVDDVVADIGPAQVERIVENLLMNAVRHTPAGTPVSLAIELVDDEVHITVEDGGAGVPDAMKESVFLAFNRGDSPAARAGGVGIGLSLVAKFAELHGGRAWVEDRPGGGARFRVVLATRVASSDLEISSPDAGRSATLRQSQQ